MKLNDWAVGGALCALILAGGALAAPPPADDSDRSDLPVEGVITNPDWDAKPSGDDLAHLYPPLAQVLAIQGSSLIRCTVEATGVLSSCRVLSEAPAGLGFGYATLLAATDFHMKPQRVDGKVVKGSITIPLTWKLDNQPAPPNPPVDPGPPPSPTSLAVARRIVAALGIQPKAAEMMDNQAKAQLDAAENNGAPFPSPDQAAAVIALLHNSFAKASISIADRQAVQLARTLSSSDLERSAAFLESPAGRAFAAAEAEVAKTSAKTGWPEVAQAYADARAAFCQKAAC